MPAPPDVEIDKIVRALVSSYWRAKAQADKMRTDSSVFTRTLDWGITQLLDKHGKMHIAQALDRLKISGTVQDNAMIHISKAVDRVFAAPKPHDSHVHVSLRGSRDMRPRWDNPRMPSPTEPTTPTPMPDLSRAGMLSECREPISIATLEGEFENVTRAALVCLCEDGIFCPWMYKKVGDDDIRALFTHMNAKMQAFEAASSPKKMVWAVPMFGCLIVNIGVTFHERASWDSQIDELYVILDYSTPLMPNMTEIRPVNQMDKRTYLSLVGDKQTFFAGGIIAGDTRIFPEPCKNPAHGGYADNKRMIDWASQTEMHHICAIFCIKHFGVCYLCIYRNDPEILRNNAKQTI